MARRSTAAIDQHDFGIPGAISDDDRGQLFLNMGDDVFVSLLFSVSVDVDSRHAFEFGK